MNIVLLFEGTGQGVEGKFTNVTLHAIARAVSASSLENPSVLHAYLLTEKNFDRAQIASLASRNEILVVAPNARVLPALLAEARTQGVPFATVGEFEESILKNGKIYGKGMKGQDNGQ